MAQHCRTHKAFLRGVSDVHHQRQPAAAVFGSKAMESLEQPVVRRRSKESRRGSKGSKESARVNHLSSFEQEAASKLNLS